MALFRYSLTLKTFFRHPVSSAKVKPHKRVLKKPKLTPMRCELSLKSLVTAKA